ncbi:metallophosphoesterase [bacterium]|nr:metallophosphoesterase [bacterium]
MISGGWNRREILSAGGIAALAGLWRPRQVLADSTTQQPALRVAHLTDIHIQPELEAARGFAQCLQNVNAMEHRPDLILTGGDHIMDGFRQPKERTARQWDLWQSVLKQENGIPIRACLGNHDIWGWDLKKSQTTGTEPQHGKRWACDILGLDRPYYSFDQAGWHFIALDSVQPSTYFDTFSAFLDDGQYAWLQQDLASVPATTPVLIWSHIPICSAVVNHLASRASIHDDSTVKASHLHADSLKLVELFTQFPNIKLCLSGHLHRCERIELKNVTYYCNGAVCGNWWRGVNDGYAEGYALLDLYADGGHDLRYVPYGWMAATAS